jgi:hypothetical protein
MDPVGIDSLERKQKPGRNVAADVSTARKALEEARAELDLAVASLPDVGGNEAMATPALLSLLIGAVTAKEHLGDLEALQARESGGGSMPIMTMTGRILG